MKKISYFRIDVLERLCGTQIIKTTICDETPMD